MISLGCFNTGSWTAKAPEKWCLEDVFYAWQFCWGPFWDGEVTLSKAGWPPTRGWKGHELNHLGSILSFRGWLHLQWGPKKRLFGIATKQDSPYQPSSTIGEPTSWGNHLSVSDIPLPEMRVWQHWGLLAREWWFNVFWALIFSVGVGWLVMQQRNLLLLMMMMMILWPEYMNLDFLPDVMLLTGNSLHDLGCDQRCKYTGISAWKGEL